MKRKKPIATPEQLLGPSPTANYEPRAYGNLILYGQNRPLFDQATVANMLTDPRVIYGLWLIKGPILSNAHVKVDCDDANLKQFIIDQINRFWANSAVKALKALEWGFSVSEVLYREKDGQVQFDDLRDFASPDCQVVIHEGTTVGVTIINANNPQSKGNRIYLGFPKAMLHLHWRERNRWYGLSRLYGAHIPWWEIWGDGGYRDIRRLWFYKNSFEGGTIRHPPGMAVDDAGTPRPNRDIARELIEKKRAGGVLTLPNTPAGDGAGQYQWIYEPAMSNPAPEGLLEYGETLRDEILEALGIPPEIISSGGDQGFGSSTGRQVPQMAFYCIIQELFQWLLSDLDYCILRPLVEVNFGPDQQYELQPFKLSEDMSEGNNTNAENFNGNQFQDENQRSEGQFPGQENVQMAHVPPSLRIYSGSTKAHHFRHNGRWWTFDGHSVHPMRMAI